MGCSSAERFGLFKHRQDVDRIRGLGTPRHTENERTRIDD
jgi:hypothetical protein